jgi:hypothetical protein
VTETEKQFSAPLDCPHCGNTAPMEMITSHSQTKEYSHANLSWAAGPIYELLVCSACGGVILRRYFYHELKDAEDWPVNILYPEPFRTPSGLPEKIEAAYRHALNLKRAQPNDYAVALGRVLELVCHDRSAKGNRLVDQLKDLAHKEKLPPTIIEMTQHLRLLRNIGAHSESDKLTATDIPLLDDLCRVILEYFYTAPQLSKAAKDRTAETKPIV